MEREWRAILFSLFGVLFREILRQGVKKSHVLDDHIAPESRVGELVGSGCLEQRHDAFYSAFFVHDVLILPVDAGGKFEALFSAQGASELKASCLLLSHDFRVPAVLVPLLSSWWRPRFGRESGAIRQRGHVLVLNTGLADILMGWNWFQRGTDAPSRMRKGRILKNFESSSVKC